MKVEGFERNPVENGDIVLVQVQETLEPHCNGSGCVSADVVGANEQFLFEVEVKVTQRDFINDFSKDKHRIYAGVNQVGGWRKNWVPNKFYFIVPPDMVDFALSKLEKHPNYGLLTVNWKNWWRSPELKTVKQAKFLHKNPTSAKALDLLLHRMSSEICGFYIKNEAEKNKTSRMTGLVKRLVKYERTGK